MSTIQVGDKGTFYPYGTSDQPGESIRAEVIHVWSDTCVNLQTDKGHTPTSVLVHRTGLGEPGAPTGYVFVPDATPNAVDPIETLIQAKGLTAPRVSESDLEANIEHVEYVKHISRSGQVLRWAVLTTRSGFAVTGAPSASVSPANDDAEVGEKVALANAKHALWPLMGYALRERLAAATA